MDIEFDVAAARGLAEEHGWALTVESAVRLTSPEPPAPRRAGDLGQRLGRCTSGGQGGQAYPFVHLAG